MRKVSSLIIFTVIIFSTTTNCLFNKLSEEELASRRAASLNLLPANTNSFSTDQVLPVLKDYFLKQVASPTLLDSAKKVQNLEDVDDVQHEEYVHWLMVTKFLEQFKEQNKGDGFTKEQVQALLDAKTMMKFSQENVNVLMKEIMRKELDRKGIKDSEKRAEVLDRFKVESPGKTDEEIVQDLKNKPFVNPVDQEKSETSTPEKEGERAEIPKVDPNDEGLDPKQPNYDFGRIEKVEGAILAGAVPLPEILTDEEIEKIQAEAKSKPQEESDPEAESEFPDFSKMSDEEYEQYVAQVTKAQEEAKKRKQQEEMEAAKKQAKAAENTDL